MGRNDLALDRRKVRAGRPSSDIGFLPRISKIHPVGQNPLERISSDPHPNVRALGCPPTYICYENCQVCDVLDGDLHLSSVVIG
jgi:hypothetical protein